MPEDTPIFDSVLEFMTRPDPDLDPAEYYLRGAQQMIEESRESEVAPAYYSPLTSEHLPGCFVRGPIDHCVAGCPVAESRESGDAQGDTTTEEDTYSPIPAMDDPWRWLYDW